MLQEQKEAVMAKALENNMGDVEMVSAEGAFAMVIADLIRLKLASDCELLHVLYFYYTE